MGRPKRADAAGHCYHMLNRANLRATIFHKPADYEAFENILDEANERFELELFAYCLMPNHWHLLVRPAKNGEMGRFAHYVDLTHTQRYHAHYHTVGQGHLYQGRYKSFPVQDDEHFLTVARYVERNAYAAGLCQRPEEWLYGSLHHWSAGTAVSRTRLASWLIRRRPGWEKHVETDFGEYERRQLDWSVRRGVPFGSDTWVESIVRRFDLESTLRPRGRPRKVEQAGEAT